MDGVGAWTPYLAAGFAAALAWLFKQAIQTGKDLTKLQTVIEYYVERQTKDAALRLEQVSNPTPLSMQLLLKRYREDDITPEECIILKEWLHTVPNDPSADSAERSAALQLLTGMRTVGKLTHPKKRWWQWVFV